MFFIGLFVVGGLALLVFGKSPKWRNHRIAVLLLASAVMAFYVADRAGDTLAIVLPMALIGVAFAAFAIRPLYRAIRSTVTNVSKNI